MIYQIFVERFAIGRPHTSASKLALPAYHVPDVTMTLRGWEDAPLPGGTDFFGGDLQGVIDHLDYVQDLGASTVYLTPIFSAPSNHKYDTTDYHRIDPQFGDEETLKRLIAELHRRGMKLVLDAVFNHVGELHPWFLAAKRGERPYRDFFTFDAAGRHDCWWGFGSLPELRLDHPLLQEILFRGKDSVLQRYLDMGVDSWRFDTALDLGLAVARDIRGAIGGRFPDAQLIGEAMAFGGAWCRGDEHFHGVMNYYLRDALLAWIGGKVSARAMSAAIVDYTIGYGPAGARRSWNVLSTHDTPRLRNAVPDDAQRRLALVAQFTLPGEPVVYYGEEIGMQGGGDPDNRRPMIWDEARWDRDVLAFYRRLISLREARAELREGELIALGDRLDGDAVAFVRHTGVPNQVSLVVINNGTQPLRQKVFVPYAHFYATLPLRDALGSGARIKVLECAVDLEIPPLSAAIYVPDDVERTNYTFYKPRILGAAWPYPMETTMVGPSGVDAGPCPPSRQ